MTRTASIVFIATLPLVACANHVAPIERAATTTPVAKKSAMDRQSDTSTLYDFEEPSEIESWRVINDGVMGGVSRSAVRVVDGTAAFSGTVSPENNGGFASVRTMVESDTLDGAAAFRLRVRGDGNRYQFRLRTDRRFDGVSYRQAFSTVPGEWTEVTLPLANFDAVYRGRKVLGAPPLLGERISQVGFLIADGQYGAFELEIDRIDVVPPSRSEARR